RKYGGGIQPHPVHPEKRTRCGPSGAGTWRGRSGWNYFPGQYTSVIGGCTNGDWHGGVKSVIMRCASSVFELAKFNAGCKIAPAFNFRGLLFENNDRSASNTAW